MGNLDVLNGGLSIDRQPEGQMEILIGMNAGSLDGVAVNERQEPLYNVSVALLPSTAQPFRPDRYKSATTDVSGRFQLRGIPPGDYNVFALEGVGEREWMNPDFVRIYQGRGQPVRIGEGSNPGIAVTVIPPRL
jgi:hypothetical protein